MWNLENLENGLALDQESIVRVHDLKDGNTNVVLNYRKWECQKVTLSLGRLKDSWVLEPTDLTFSTAV